MSHAAVAAAVASHVAAASVGLDWQGKYPYNNNNESCDWILESKSPNIDFVCMHSYADQLRKDDPMEKWLE
jgi:hypothetical protein